MTSAVYTTGGDCGSTDSVNPDRPKCLTDDAGNKSSMTYDAVGNLTSKTDTTATGGAAVKYTWSKPGSTDSATSCSPIAGQLCSITKGNGNVTRYTYDKDGNLTKVTPPAPLGAQTFEYDALGRMIAAVDGRGQHTVYAYDNQDRQVRKDIPASGNYPAWSDWFTYDADGNRTYDPATHEYDAQNRETKVTTDVNTGGFTVAYDPAGNVTSATDGSGQTTTYTYDAANQLTTAGFPGATCTTDLGSQTDCVKFGYDANGRETKRVLPADTVQDVTYDASGRITRIKAASPNEAHLNDFQYTYTTSGGADRTQVQTMTDNVGYTYDGKTVVPAGAVTSYTYDSLKRLTAATEKTSTGGPSAAFAYAYDKNGNRTSAKREGNLGWSMTAGTTTYGYDAADQLTTINSDTKQFAYDADGNELTAPGDPSVGIPGRAMAWTADGADGAVAWAYKYTNNNDHTGVMWWNHGNTHHRSMIGLDTTTTDTNGTTKYLLAPSGKPLGYKWAKDGNWKNAEAAYYLTDRQGSITSIAGGQYGNEAAIYRYTPYGEHRVTDEHYDGTQANRLGYHGLLYDDATGLWRTTTRWYDSTLGRFTQPDTSAEETNPYLYAAGAPNAMSDPSGEGPGGCTEMGSNMDGYCGRAAGTHNGPKRRTMTTKEKSARDQCVIWGAGGAVAGLSGGPVGVLAGFVGGCGAGTVSGFHG